MIKKDYELIAKAIKGTHVYIDEREGGNLADLHDGASLAAELMADALQRDNPRFDRAKFLKACGVES
jgi:hypothetical protein